MSSYLITDNTGSSNEIVMWMKKLHGGLAVKIIYWSSFSLPDCLVRGVAAAERVEGETFHTLNVKSWHRSTISLSCQALIGP